MGQLQVVRVSSQSKAKVVALVLIHFLDKGRPVEIRTIGAGALNQAIKSLIFVRERRMNIGFSPFFSDVNVEGQIKTAIFLKIINLDLDG